MELIQVLINFVYKVSIIPISMGSYSITIFGVISFAIVCGLFWKLIFGGGKGE
jgi:hypothetical protein